MPEVLVDIEYGAVRPLAAPQSNRRSNLKIVAIAACMAALVCVAALGSPQRAPGVASLTQVVEISKAEVEADQEKAKAELDSHAEQKAGSIRGSRPTAEEEANAIIGEGSGSFDKKFDKPYYEVEGPHNDLSKVADAIIDNANRDGVDITGAGKADSYINLVRSQGADAAKLTGSLPNFKAESNYITSGVVDNFEKKMEDWPVLPARTVADGIIDSVTSDRDNLDCTGVVGPDGVHNTAGTPPCPKKIKVQVEA
ncbi:hypothetical protein T484DRAFT_1970554 [Baffinella frigidus]|nr:hypothetical protein T484DRAFT_1970554 [Cryptophyta sp. CCMP2293]